MADGFSPRDLDLLARTVAGEDPTPEGQAAVAHVVMNRLASGRYGKSPTDIVLAPNQFEPWSARGRELMNMRTDSPQYQQALQAVQGVVNGDIPDPTNGATHFYAPKAQAALGRNAPTWATQNQPTARVGAHVYYAPQGETDGMLLLGGTRAPQADNAPNLGSPDLPAMAYAPTAKADSMPQAKAAFDLASHLGLDTKADDQKSDGAFDLASHLGLDDSSSKAAPAAAPTSTGDLQGTALAAGLVNGVPIAGPYILSGLEKTGAAANAVLNNSRYSDELAAIQKRTADAEALHGAASTVGNLVGAGAGYAAASAPAMGARALGMVGSGVGRILAGGASNALIGGADAAVRGEDPATGVVVGGLGGLAAPVAGGLAGKALGGTVNYFRNMGPTGIPELSRPAANALVGLTEASGGPAQVVNKLTGLGPDAMLLDASHSFKSIGGGLAADAGSSSAETVKNALDARNLGRDPRLATDVQVAIGKPPIPSRITAGIDDAQKSLQPEYTKALQGARAVDTQPLADSLDASVANLRGDAQSAVKKVRSFLNIPGTDQLDPNPSALLATRHAIDGMMTTEADPNVIRNLSMARQTVDQELTKAVPGIKDVDAKYQELARQAEGLTQGGKILDSGKTAIHPEDLAQTFPQSANPAGTLVGPSAVPFRVQQGASAEINRLTGTKSNDLVALKSALQGEGGWNTKKLATVFGEEPANRLVNAVDRESTFANTANEIAQNSKTPERKQALAWLKQKDPLEDLPSNVTPGGLAIKAGKKLGWDPIMREIMQSSNQPMKDQLAHIMTAQGPTRDALLQNFFDLYTREGRGRAIASGTNAGARALTHNALLGMTGTRRSPL